MSALRSGRVLSRAAAAWTILLALVVGSTVVVLAVLPDDGGREASVRPDPAGGALTSLRAVVGDLPATTLTVGGASEGVAAFTVLLATTPDARQRGLRGVTSLPPDVGMLFILPDPPGPAGRPGFWMLDVPIALDIAFLAGDVSEGVAQVVGVATMAPCASLPCPVTRTDVVHHAALEVAAGGLVRAGIEVGVTVSWDVSPGEARR